MIRSFVIFSLAAAVACAAQTTTAPATQPPPASSAAPQHPAPAAPPAPSPTAKPGGAPDDSTANVPAAEPVISIQGICSSTPTRKMAAVAAGKEAATPAAAAPCKTLVTKEQFEKLLEAVNTQNQPVTPMIRRNFAQQYVDMVTFSQAARKAGIDKDPGFNQYMQLLRMRVLKEFYLRQFQEKYRNPPPAELQAYYNQNLPKYEQIKVDRIFIPAKNPASASKDDWEKKAAQEANDIRDRAAKGEDFEKLQKEAYTTLGLTTMPPATNVGMRRRGMMSATNEKELFELKPGDVSKLEQEPAGYIIYKVESKDTQPLEQVKEEISRELFRQKMESMQKSITSAVHADFDDKYFGPPAAPPTASGPNHPPLPGMREPVGSAAPKAPAAAAPAPTPPSNSSSPTAPGQTPPK